MPASSGDTPETMRIHFTALGMAGGSAEVDFVSLLVLPCTSASKGKRDT